jgi:2-oxoglutarate ferredoxin oxidoreductase subunit alpha
MAAAKKRSLPTRRVPIQDRDELTIRFAGDSGDGMLLAGTQFTRAAVLSGNVACTLAQQPAEIRAPVGTLAGVCGLQVRFGNGAIHTPGDALDALVAMTPAALRANLADVKAGGMIIANADTFTDCELPKAGYAANPLIDGSLAGYRVLLLAMDKLNRAAIAQMKLSPREVDRCKTFFALGVACWLFDKPLEPTLAWIKDKFAKNPAVLEANSRTLCAGYNHGETTELDTVRIRVDRAALAKGRYRTVSGNQALVLGLVAAADRADLQLAYAGAPGLPAAELLHRLAEVKSDAVLALQAEDDIGALTMALGASFGGALGATAASGPGMSLSAEALGLAVMAELPCIVINVQRGGPSSGLPTKTEQADLFQALFGRHGECPLAVLAAASPSDCFAAAYEAARIAVRFMTPVVLLSDLHLAQSAEPWRIPATDELQPITFQRSACAAGEPFLPYARDERLVRPWAIPGAPGLEHRVGGLEKEDKTGNVSYEPVNHEKLVRLRAAKIDRIAEEVPPLAVHGSPEGELLVLGWGSTRGAIVSAVDRACAKGQRVACAHFRYLHPLPKNTGEVLGRFRHVLVAELNGGQLLWLLRARFLIAAVGYNKVQGSSFTIAEVEAKIAEMVRD